MKIGEGKNNVLEEKVAYRQHIVCDQGNGGSYCSNCQYDLGSDAFVSYETCPGCGCELRDTHNVWISPGGSDF